MNPLKTEKKMDQCQMVDEKGKSFHSSTMQQKNENVFHDVNSRIGGNTFCSRCIFVLSGFLNAFSVSQEYDRSNGNISWINIYVHRFLRITPGYMIILGLHATLFSYTGSGPLWPIFDTNPRCKENWWKNLVYINNFQSINDQVK
ncbi:nose resistant to fluoxetine protein 6 [Nephila pilipes]|uniref:Nose resistant to fluoxetine protein 6 n=1 Tax=Nephila pilipes TaxID=299642 RepID=A0A8X6QET9_NEPPI|nr:nose resistant to fluoxetine protein 6 [Nephila pilipes]